MVKIVTDSLSDISPEKAKELGIAVVPLNVHFGDNVYKDGIELPPDEFYKKLVEGSVFPTTSAPPPGVFAELFTNLAKETNEIIAIMASDKISAVHESALQGKALVKVNCKIEVINTRWLIGAEAILVILALEAAKSGANLEAIVDLVKKAMPRLHALMMFDTLEYLKRGGRIGKAQAFLGSLLKIHPILTLKDGEVHPFERARNRAQAKDILINYIKKFSKLDRVVVEHATTPEESEEMIERLSVFVPKNLIIRSRVGSVIGTHAGPHILAVSFLTGESA
jgi:DegV family protein with EDD domain